MAESVESRLQAIHEAGTAEPLPEGFEIASCGPAAKHLAHLAMHTAACGGTEDDWRAWVAANVEEASPKMLAGAEECMHEAGLWPWRD